MAATQHHWHPANGSFYMRYLLIFAIILSLELFSPAIARNLTALILINRLVYTNVLQSSMSTDAPSVPLGDIGDVVPSWLPASPMRPVLKTWDSLLTGRTESGARSLLQASDLGSGFTRSLDDFIRLEEERKGSVLSVDVPIGLAEYEYGLALRGIEQQDWHRSLEHFERAVAFRPGPWTESFYLRYYKTLTQVAPDIAIRIAVEQSVPAESMPQINVGRKDQPGWDMPISVADGWYLQGFTIRSWTAIERGLPVIADLFWKHVSGRILHHTAQTWNLVPNGGFEFGTTSRSIDFRWFQRTYDNSPFSSPPLRTVMHDGRSSNVLVLLPCGPEHDNEIFTRLIQVMPNSSILWSTWIEKSDDGNPHIFVTWLNSQKRQIKVDIPMQGNASGVGRNYAGVLQVPDNASYMSLVLTNYKASGETLWDNLLLIELPRPPGH